MRSKRRKFKKVLVTHHKITIGQVPTRAFARYFILRPVKRERRQQLAISRVIGKVGWELGVVKGNRLAEDRTRWLESLRVRVPTRLKVDIGTERRAKQIEMVERSKMINGRNGASRRHDSEEEIRER